MRTLGCGKPFNEQIDLVGTEPLPALSVDADAEPLSEARSLQGFDRRSWPVVTVQVPTMQTAHYRTYVHNLHLREDKAGGPWDERFPTAVGSLADADSPNDVLDGLVEPFWAAGLLVWAPIDMVLLRLPWQGIRSPDEPYDRVPPDGRTDLWPWIDVGQPDIRWTDEAAGAGEPH
jgi:hypothetical protein